jgi:branched-chain amino acid transport system permease protein
MNYLFHIIVLIGLYVMLSQSLNIVMGYGGLVSVCQAAFYGLGAYTCALLMVFAGWSFLTASAAAIAVTGAVAFFLSFPAVRFRDDFFMLATLGFQMIVFTVLYNWVDLTRGAYGVAGIPRPSAGDVTVEAPWAYALLVACVACVLVFTVHRILSSAYGRTLRAVRDDQLAAQSLGKNVDRFRRSAFTIAGTLAAIPGVLFACYATYIDPTSFTIEESVFILSIVIIGGAGNIRGPLLGAVLMVLLPEGLRFVQIPDSVAANVRQIIYGLLIVVLMNIRPQGIAGKYAFD